MEKEKSSREVPGWFKILILITALPVFAWPWLMPGNVCICRKSRWRCFALGFGHVVAFVCGFVYVD